MLFLARSEEREGFGRLSPNGTGGSVLNDHRIVIIRKMQMARRAGHFLLTKAELRDERLITGGINFLQIIKQLAARVDHRQQATA